MKKFALVAFFMGMVGVAVAADKNDPSGTWKWKTKFGKNEVDVTAKIEAKDGKVSGTMTAGKNETKLEEGTFKDGVLKFNATRDRKGEKVTTKYEGKISDDGKTMKFTSTTDVGGKEVKTEFEAKKE